MDLKPKIGSTVVDNVDTTVGPFVTANYFWSGMRAAGINPFPTSADLLVLYTDVTDFDATTRTGSEIILVMLDPSGTAFSGTNIPNPLTPLSNSFFIYLETVNLESLPLHHRDPFDRLLIAQALEEKLHVVTTDPAFNEYGVKRIW